MAADRPGRPRLAGHMLGRRHVVDGREFVLLHDEARRETLELERVTWAVLSCADGTRDVEGIVAAAGRIGAPTTARAVNELLDALHDRGALEEGPPAHAPDTVTLRRRPDPVASLPVSPLPGYRFSCDGDGGCCRSYGSVLLTPDDRDRARVALPDHRIAGVPAQRWFTPDRGSAPTPLAVPVSVDGGCGFLGSDGLCEIHRRCGLEGKPRACAAFPVVACADDEAVRVSVVPECACVLRPGAPGEGDVLGEGWSQGGDLPGTTVIDVLPERVRVTEQRTVSRGWVREQVHALLQDLQTAPDLAMLCWQRADVWAEGKPTAPALQVDALRHDARDLLRRRSAHCRSDDWVLRSLQWLVGTLALLEDDTLTAAVLAPTTAVDPMETLYVRASLWVYRGFDERPASDVLRGLATRLWLARAMAEVPLAPSPRAVPLASLSMLLRGHGLSRSLR